MNHCARLTTNFARRRVSGSIKSTLTNFGTGKSYFKDQILKNGVVEYQETYHAPQPIASVFRQAFPSIVEERGILESATEKNTSELYHNNRITIRETPITQKQMKAAERVDFQGVGGPTAVGAAALAKAGGLMKVAHSWYTRRGSNADGSAYYYHIRDAFPVYINSVNRGPYCVYTDIMKRLQTKEKLEEWAREDADYVKIHLNWKNLLADLSLLWEVFIPNLFKMIDNIYIKKPEDSDISSVVKHSARAKTIASALQQALGTNELLHHGRQDTMACYAGVTDNKDVGAHFNWLAKFCNDIKFEKIQPKDHGLGVKQLLWFPEDGCLSPTVFEQLRDRIDEATSLEAVDEITVDKDRGVLTSFRNRETGEQRTVLSPTAVVSFGPSADLVDDDGARIGKKSMWAAGSSSVIFVAIPLPKDRKKRSHIEQKACKRFLNYLDSVNQHWTPIETIYLIDDDGVEYLSFALQMTGGGNFPSRYTRPDVIYNLMFNFERIFWDTTDKQPYPVYYDLIQARGCPRAVTADNTIAFKTLGNRLTVAYGQGGIGMTTMFPNAELALQLAGTKRPLDIYGGTDPLQGLDFSSMVDDYEVMVKDDRITEKLSPVL